MPHKKAKHSARQDERRSKGNDLAPHGSHTALETEPIPKSFARVLNASSVRSEYKKRKRNGEGDSKDPGAGQRKRRKIADGEAPLHLLPGESLGSFNRRVEDNMRPQMRLAVQTGQANARRQNAVEKEERAARKEAKSTAETQKDTKGKTQEGSATPLAPPSGKDARGKTEFDSVSSQKPKRLNDIVAAPPDLQALLKKNKVLQKTKKGGEVFGKNDIISPEQKRMMEVEREKAIKRYRELKEKKQDGR
ncbi:hypothetical protein M408DRAFT_81193 [Serendipita vermifera MAFF 305830]|uniref:Uncharacterized protein n=1 Tax=Serendipita vermifera MAFF 305830 TaxID=933852 RepID=A0A0C3A8M5_SERVB|nr:hypothetical protein M408DRAFT_81193 [Serendipita vermifera MAFF 305830]